MPVPALVAAGALVGVSENNVRVALSRLRSRDLVESDGRGAWRLGPNAAHVQDLVSSWRSVEKRTRRWSGDWIAANTSSLPKSRRTEVRSSLRALELLGFRELHVGLAVRPDNLAGDVSTCRRRLEGLGLSPSIPVFTIGGLSSKDGRRAQRLWDVPSLRRRYDSIRRRLSESAARLPNLPPNEARVESYLLGGAAIRTIVRDPLLPDPLLPAHELRSLVSLMLEYDRLGRACWAGALEAHGATNDRGPAHLGPWPQEMSHA